MLQKTPANAVRAVWAVIAAFALVLCVALVLSYRSATQLADQQILAVVRLVEEHASDTIDRADLSLQAALELLAPEDLRAGSRLDDARRQRVEQGLIAIHRRTPGIVSLSLTDAEGRVVANSVGMPPGIGLGDREYFLELKGAPRFAPVVSEAMKGRVSNKWGLQVARRIELPDGRFAGVMIANVGLEETFEKFYQSIDLGEGGLITLRDQQNRMLVRWPAAPELRGKPVPGSAANQFVAAGSSEQVFRATSPIDGIDRILAIRRLPRQPIYALAGIATTVAFRFWRIEVIAAVCLIIASFFVGRYIAATLTARIKAEHGLRDLNLQLEQRVADRTASLEQAMSDLESFSYSVSHDLRAPLRAINGYATLVRDAESEQLKADSRGMLDRVIANAEKMGRLIDDILDYSRAGRAPLARGAVELAPLVAAVVAELREAYPRTEVAMADLPAVSGDPTMLRQVLQNLIENAFKFSAKVDHPRIEIAASRAGGAVECRIRDNGAGFDPQYAQKMFRMFQRMHPESEFPGTGVGLAIVHRLVARHGGSVRAESQPGRGATFLVTLPA